MIVPQQPAYGQDGFAMHEGNASVGMPEIVHPDVFQPCLCSHGLPDRLILRPRLTPSWPYSTGWTSSISDGGLERRDRALFGKMMSNITAWRR